MSRLSSGSKHSRVAFLLVLTILIATVIRAQSGPPSQSVPPQTIEIDASAAGRPFPHFWEKMFGSGRAILTLRESYRNDLRETKRITGFDYVRFHAIFHDEVGVYDEVKDGMPLYNFSYVDQIYDGLLKDHVRPFIELSFMPKKLTADPKAIHPFWYKQNVAPPRSWEIWEQMIEKFTRHLVERYGEDEVTQWYFEVWNEPNIDFWAGNPKEATYYELYDRTARAIKRVSPRLRVGGPSTAQAAWVDRFIRHAAENNVPVDFVSTHVYGNDLSTDVFGTNEVIPRSQMVCRAARKVYDQVKASAKPDLPIIWSEYNASYMNEPNVTDALYMGPWMADTIRQCDGLAEMWSYWTFSDVFEEQGVVKQPFYGGFGLLAAGGLPKPSFNDFAILHMLGDQRLQASSDSALVTRRADGALVVALWNLVPPGETGAPRSFRLHLKGMSATGAVRMWRVDQDHGDVLPAYEKMGRPQYPTVAQLIELKRAGALAPPENLTLKDGELSVLIPSSGLAVIEIH
jgi:xylan 1,4-beta-xylosidase